MRLLCSLARALDVHTVMRLYRRPAPVHPDEPEHAAASLYPAGVIDVASIALCAFLLFASAAFYSALASRRHWSGSSSATLAAGRGKRDEFTEKGWRLRRLCFCCIYLGAA